MKFAMHRLTVVIAALFAGATGESVAQSLTLYAGTNFSGESRQVSLVNTNVGGFVARSADAQGKWRVCSGPFGLIGCRTIEGKVADLGGSGLTVVSAVYGVGTGGSSTGSTTAGQPGSGIMLYAGTSYSGKQQALNADTANLASAGFGDLAQSAMAAPGETWQLCEHAEYQGRCIQVSGVFPSLSPIAGTVSSARRWTGGQQTTTQPTASYPAQSGYGSLAGRTATFFAQPLFNGQPMRACPDNPSKPSVSCAKKSALQFCRLSGFAKLAYSSYSSQGMLEDVLCTK